MSADRKAQKATPAARDHRASAACRARRGLRDPKAIKVTPARRASKEYKDHRASRGRKARRALLVLTVQMVKTVVIILPVWILPAI